MSFPGSEVRAQELGYWRISGEGVCVERESSSNRAVLPHPGPLPLGEEEAQPTLAEVDRGGFAQPADRRGSLSQREGRGEGERNAPKSELHCVPAACPKTHDEPKINELKILASERRSGSIASQPE